ncbi:MAG: GNAT family N-acetyltransferase [Mycobacteriales bacterium]
MDDEEIRRRLERYLDAVPRPNTEVETIGALTLFAKVGNGWPYYARPTLGSAEVTADDVSRVRERQRELNLPQTVEWVDETTPSLRPVIEQAGMPYQALPLMVLRTLHPVGPPEGADVRLLRPDDPLLPLAIAVAYTGFASPGTAAGPAGVDERDAAVAEMTPERVEFVRARMHRGLTVSAVAVDHHFGPLSVGSHNPLDGVTEIVGVATLPSARRRGLGAAVTARLVADAEERGVTLIFLSAGSEDIARLYAQLGFERVGTSCIAEVPLAAEAAPDTA